MGYSQGSSLERTLYCIEKEARSYLGNTAEGQGIQTITAFCIFLASPAYNRKAYKIASLKSHKIALTPVLFLNYRKGPTFSTKGPYFF